ncbi:uncharacterized protein CMU_026310 [Cryptosporidium muris RN66]|uniref:Uncharacterized protein n=1 Tax=Cryptosporidium muris (strain RN66) TaxID=441375 RepID=B6AB72_CRYMR|nr:uncharacterized protein CMU_026310 [Cryptosporidium muris RN66]EEA05624.1 hypothetical protein, conserved [Cryptosporidium muris RN66]|eukprot:XP_002139973.1 hypothetical protein [Cryptosporidium muris RN66]
MQLYKIGTLCKNPNLGLGFLKYHLKRSLTGFNYIRDIKEMYKETIDKSKKFYFENKEEIDKNFIYIFQSNPLVLFMEGTPDYPMSELSSNTLKIFTVSHVNQFLAIDVLQHPGIMGFALSCNPKHDRFPILYKFGKYYANHDEILELFENGKLLESLFCEKVRTNIKNINAKNKIFKSKLKSEIPTYLF